MNTTTEGHQDAKTGTEYVVLEKRQGDGVWKEVGAHMTASSHEAAIRNHIARMPATELDSEFVAIPARSFKAVKVRVEQVSHVRLEPA